MMRVPFQKTTLQFYVLLARNLILGDVLKLCSGSSRRIRSTHTAAQFLKTSNITLAVQQWASIGLLQHQTSPSASGYAVPSFVKTAIFKDLANDLEQAESLLDLGWLLLTSAQDQRGLPSAESRVESIAKTVNCFRDLCVAAKDLSLNPSEDTQGCLLMAALHYVE